MGEILGAAASLGAFSGWTLAVLIVLGFFFGLLYPRSVVLRLLMESEKRNTLLKEALEKESRRADTAQAQVSQLMVVGGVAIKTFESLPRKGD